MTGQSLAHDAVAADAAALDFYDRLLAGDFSAILDAFENEPNVDAPRSGAVVGRDAVGRFLEEELAWLEGLGASIDGLRHVKETNSLEAGGSGGRDSASHTARAATDHVCRCDRFRDERHPGNPPLLQLRGSFRQARFPASSDAARRSGFAR